MVRPSWFVAFSLASGLSWVEAGSTLQDEKAPQAGASEAAPRVAVTLEGFVTGPGGLPAADAMVVTSAGGKAFTDERGRYRIEVSLPLEAESLQVTAVASSGRGLFASTRVSAPGSGGGVPVDPLRLASTVACPREWLPTFGSRPGVSGAVHAMAVFDDGRGPALYVGGLFEFAGGIPVNFVARWDGAAWEALGGGMDGSVSALAVHDDGTGPALYAGGAFRMAGGVAAERIARWDGSAWSAVGGGMNQAVLALAVHDDGSGPNLYAGGSFRMVEGAPAERIARWNGTGWSTLGSGLNGRAYAMMVHDDGSGPKLIVGGDFTTADGSPANRVARWDGSGWSTLGGGMDGRVYALAEYDDGLGMALYAGGAFSTADGRNALRLARWKSSQGWRVLAASSGIADGVVTALTVGDDGTGQKLYLGGTFSDEYQHIVSFDGSTLSEVPIGVDGDVLAMAVYEDGGGASLYLGGEFCRWPGTDDLSCDVNFLARLPESGVLETVGGPGLDGSVLDLAVHDDGSGPALFAAGSFLTAGGVPLGSIARRSGASWVPVGTGVGGGYLFTHVTALIEFDDGSGPALYACGDFRSAGGTSVNRIARWDGAAWSALGSGLGGNSVQDHVAAMAVYDDGGGPALFAAGYFNDLTPIGTHALSIARWDGASWSALGLGLYGRVDALEVFDDGSGPALYAGGDFTKAGGAPIPYLARWDGAAWSEVGGGVSSWVHALAVHDDGSGAALFAGGSFGSAGSPAVSASRIAKYDGSAWSPLGSGMNLPVASLASFDDGTGPILVASGEFTVAGGLAVNKIASWDGVTWSALGSGLSEGASSLLGHEGALLAAGSFVSALDSGDSYIARYGRPEDTLAPVLDCPGLVAVVDTIGTPPGEIVTFSVTASDGCDPAPSIVCVPPSGSFFPRGTTIVTCTAADASGNQSSCQFAVQVWPKARRR